MEHFSVDVLARGLGNGHPLCASKTQKPLKHFLFVEMIFRQFTPMPGKMPECQATLQWQWLDL